MLYTELIQNTRDDKIHQFLNRLRLHIKAGTGGQYNHAHLRQLEHVFQIPAPCALDYAELPTAEEFVAKENLHIKNDISVCEGVMADDDTVHMANLPAANDPTIRQAALTFDPLPFLEELDEYSIATDDDQAELMHWHYHLGHLSFNALKQLAL